MEATSAKKSTVKKAQAQLTTTKVALFAPNSLVHPSLGRLNKGYTIVTSDKAQEWIKISEKVREATPQEVASAFEV
jgi:hypothetical protein